MMSLPRCSVIVPSYQSEQTVRQCLDALRAQDAQFAFEVILVDSGSDSTTAIVASEYPEVQLIHLSERAGPEKARNIGAERASGEILAFVDSDCVAQPCWLTRLVARLDEGYEAIGGATSNGNPGSLVSWAGYLCEFREFLPTGRLRPMPYLSPNTVAYPATVFWSVGGFPEGFYPIEDQVFHQPLRQRGARIALDPSIVVAHTHRTVRSEFLSHQRRIGAANARALQAIGGRGALFARSPVLTTIASPLLVPYRFVRTVIACARVENALILRRLELAWLCWLGMCWWARGFIDGAGKGHGDVQSRHTWARTSTPSN